MRKVPSLKILEKLPNPTEGEIAFCEKENASFVYRNGCWGKNEPVEVNSGISLYEMNRNIISQMPPIDMDKERESILDELTEWVNGYKDTYYMIYGREISYFTVIHKDEFSQEETIPEVVLECLANLGDLYSVSQEPGGYEFWVKTENDFMTCLYLFPYDAGVVEVR